MPATFVFLLCFFSLPFPRPTQKLFGIIKAPFKQYLTLHEAEALDLDSAAGDKVTGDEDVGVARVEVPDAVPLWRAVVFALLGLLETLCWMSYGSFRLINDPEDIWAGSQAFLIAIVWLYTVLRPITRPAATSPFDLFAIYCVQLMAGILQLGGVLFDHHVAGAPFPPKIVILALSANLVTLVALLTVVLNMPLAIPSNRVKKEDIVSMVETLSVRSNN